MEAAPRVRRRSTVSWGDDAHGGALAMVKVVSPLPASAYLLSPEPAPALALHSSAALDATLGRGSTGASAQQHGRHQQRRPAEAREQTTGMPGG